MSSLFILWLNAGLIYVNSLFTSSGFKKWKESSLLCGKRLLDPYPDTLGGDGMPEEINATFLCESNFQI
jgi:hypothetical protein